MAVDFLTAEQKAQYGQFAGDPNEIQLARYFHLDEADLTFILNRRGDQNKFGFALQLTAVRFLGCFLSDLTLVPANVQTFVAGQLSIGDVAILADYAQRDTTKREHTALIREQYGYREFSDPPWAFRLSRLLYTRAWISNERPSLMFDFATAWLNQNKVLLPGATTLSRLISEIRERAVNRLWRRLAALPTLEQKAKLETLIQVPEGTRSSSFDRYQKGPVTISGPAFNASVERYLELKALGMQEIDFSHIPPVRLKNLARHAGVITVPKIARMPEDKRTAILVAFVKAFETIALDYALDVLDLLITGIAGNAKRIGQKNRLRTLKDLDKSALTLADVCTLILNEETQNDQLRDVIFTRITKERLEESIAIVHDLARPYDDKFHDELIEQYGRVCRFSPRLADAGEAVFWRIDKNADYGVLNDLARGSVNTRRIEQHWDDMLRIAGSLKLGTIQASELIRSLLKSDRPSSLTKAIIDAGRINKTLYLLNYIDDEDYRRRILTQLNRGEGRHAVARVICHGQRGEIRKRYREGQEDQLGALGLVTNAVVLWNTLYMQAALDHLRQQPQEIREEDEKRLSPLLHGHVNVLGHYTFTLAEQIMMGQLRPLNQPSENIIILP